MSVTAIFNQLEGQSLSIDNAIHPCPTLYLRGDILVNNDGLIIAERIVDEQGRIFWEPIGGDNESTLVERENAFQRKWLCQEIAFVGQGRLNI